MERAQPAAETLLTVRFPPLHHRQYMAASAMQRERTGRIQARGQRHDAGGRDAAPSWLAADQSAVAAGRRIEPPVCVPTAAMHMPLATAAAEPLLDPPGCAHVPWDARRRRIKIRELRGDGLAKNDRSGLPQPRYKRRVFNATACRRQAPGAGRHARHVDQVLHADRNAMQRPERLALAVANPVARRNPSAGFVNQHPGMSRSSSRRILASARSAIRRRWIAKRVASWAAEIVNAAGIGPILSDAVPKGASASGGGLLKIPGPCQQRHYTRGTSRVVKPPRAKCIVTA